MGLQARTFAQILFVAILLFQCSGPALASSVQSVRQPSFFDHLFVEPYESALPSAKPSVCPTVGAQASTCSSNWSGYVDVGANGSATEAFASWAVPAVSCPPTGLTIAAEWVGIDGYSDFTVEQTGVIGYCDLGTAGYAAWYEFYPAASVYIQSVVVAPGDQITANVTYSQATGNFTIGVSSSGGGSFNATQHVPGAEMNSAEWVVERPTLCYYSCFLATLANFHSTGMGFDYTGATGTNDATFNGTEGSVGSVPYVAVTMLGTKRGPVEAEPTALSQDGTSFAVNVGFGSLNPGVTVSCAGASVLVGTRTRCTADVSGGAATGLVTWSSTGVGTFSSSTCTLKRGSCSVSYKLLYAGFPSNITAGYLGNALEAASSGNALINESVVQSTTTVKCTPLHVVAGSANLVTCKVRVSGYRLFGFAPFGYVNFTQSGTGQLSFLTTSCFLGSKTGKCSVQAFASVAGAVTVTAAYSGDPDNNQSGGSAQVTVLP